MTTEENKRFRKLLQECGMDEEVKQELVYQFSDGVTTSSKELSKVETTALLKYLQDTHSAKCKPMRGKIIHYLCLLGYTLAPTQADWGRINDFIKNIGSNNPRKVQLNFLYFSELPKVVSQVEAMYRKELGKLAK